MRTISITARTATLIAPGELALHVNATNSEWVGIPLMLDSPASLPQPHVEAAWCSVNGLPLPVIVNLDGSGDADIAVDINVPPEVPVGSYHVTFTAGYPGDTTQCPTLTVTVDQVATPSLKGMTLDAARQTLAVAHLELGTVLGIQTDDCKVVSQDPLADVTVLEGSVVTVQVEPSATKVSTVNIVNCTIFDYDVWVNDLTISQWSRWPGSPLPKSTSLDCPPPGAPVAAIVLESDHYYDVRAAWSGFDFHSEDPTNWRLPHGTLLGASEAPVLRVQIT